MCGIAGQVFVDPDGRADPSLLARMCESLRHRGPDDVGMSVMGRAALGIRRLSVIDLPGGHQPIENEDGSVSLVFNGEIYNFQELRRALESRGHRFKTASDTEVIVHLYEEDGDACVEKLRGMFAIALWDHNGQKLLLARDRLGVKPLYYYVDGRRLLFGSEIKAILQDPSVRRSVDLDGIDQMLTYGYMVAPTTCFKGIKELPHASTLSYVDGRVQVNRYWDLTFEEEPDYEETPACDTLLSLLKEAVRLRMNSDVPLGALLSGGIDSALTVALMSMASSEPVKTFSIGFDEPGYSELPLARQVAKRYGTEHHEFVVKPDVINILPTLIKHHDAPFYDSSAIPTYYVCKMAREHVTVALSGDGGDELFAGYNLYRGDKAAEYYRRLPRWIRQGVLTPLARRIPDSTAYLNTGRMIREFTRAASLDPIARYTRWVSKVKEETRRELYKDPSLYATLDSGSDGHLPKLFGRQPRASRLNRMLYVDINTELACDILLKVDRMSMACSLEVRSPLLDHHVHEFAATLPDRAKLKGWQSKYLLRALAKRLLPADLLRKPKQGFSIPLDRWLRTDLAGYVREILFDPITRGRGYFHPHVVEKLVEDHVAGPIGYGREIWTLLTIELWHRLYIDGLDVAVPHGTADTPVAG